MKYLLVDTSNMFWRSRHVASRGTDQWAKIGYALHITISSINKVFRDIGGDHIIFCLEGRSWRKDVYEPYKKNRVAIRESMTSDEKEDDKMYFEAYNDMVDFFKNKTACTVLQHQNAEADDFIARWIHLHPNDEHVIISSDTDFYQLLTDKVTQYNGITNEYITVNGVFNDKMKPVQDKKTKQQKTIGNPQYVLFEKCMRGDPTDNVFSAYPGVRKKSSKNKIGLEEAYADINKKGYAWNNLMLQRWTDHNGVEHRVLDDYEMNKLIIDLTMQPDNFKQAFDEAIHTSVNSVVPSQIGTHFLKFCGKYDLVKISEQASTFSHWMKKEYKGINLVNS